MRIYLDTCDINAIKKYHELGIIDGVTTNPSIIAKSGKNLKDAIEEICKVVDTSISAEVLSLNYEDMIKEGSELAAIAPQITIKLPITHDGLKACGYFANKDIRTNMTLCFSATQALLAAKVGATYVSPFLGRIDDMGQSSLKLIEDIISVYENYPDISTQILAASIRDINHVIQVASLGVDVATLPVQLIEKMIYNPLTEKGLEIFKKDYENSKN